MTRSNDPTVVDTVVVTAADLVTALEASRRTGNADTVLRMTPPFSGRMRARLHVRQGRETEDQAPVVLPAEAFVNDRCPAPPDPDGVEDAFRADPTETYSVERHRERYRVALQQWRSSVPEYVRTETQLPGTDETITISLLGTVPDE